MSDNEKSRSVTEKDIIELEKFADTLFKKVGIDVEFTRHFHQRVNDVRNKKQITVAELVRLFKQTYRRYGQKLAQYGPDFEAVLQDMKTNINLPFVLAWDKKNQELDLVAKTVMRKPNFKTHDKTLAFESYEKVADFPVEVKGYGVLTIETAEKSAKKKINELNSLANSASSGDFRSIQQRLDSGVLQAILAALTEAYDKIEQDPELSQYLDENNCRALNKEQVREQYKEFKKK